LKLKTTTATSKKVHVVIQGKSDGAKA